jgi:hypothetical protein
MSMLQVFQMFRRKSRWQKLTADATKRPAVAAGAAVAGAAALTVASAAVSSVRRKSSSGS